MPSRRVSLRPARTPLMRACTREPARASSIRSTSSTCAVPSRPSPNARDVARPGAPPGSCWPRSRWRRDGECRWRSSGMPASRYLEAIAGAMASSVWNSITRSTSLAHELLGVAERDLRLIAVVEDDQLDVFAPRRRAGGSRGPRGRRRCPVPGRRSRCGADGDAGPRRPGENGSRPPSPGGRSGGGYGGGESTSPCRSPSGPRRRAGAAPRRRTGTRPGSGRHAPPTGRCTAPRPASAWGAPAIVSQSITRRATRPARSKAWTQPWPEGRKPRSCVRWMANPTPFRAFQDGEPERSRGSALDACTTPDPQSRSFGVVPSCSPDRRFPRSSISTSAL